MATDFSLKDAEKRVNAAGFTTLVRHHAKERGLSLDQLSVLLGKPAGYVHQQLGRKTLSMALLYGLSMHLQVNLFGPFLSQMPAYITVTPAEKALQQQLADQQQQIESLRQQLAALEKQKEIYEGMLKRG